MGGFGSGRRGYKQKAESCRSLDVNRFHREGCLRPGHQGNWVWSHDGEEDGRIGYRATETSLILDYKFRPYGDDWVPITETVPLTYLDCHYGGQRPYFRCPGVVNGHHCGRRVGKLFAGGRYFLCRHCYSVAYASQSEPACDRALRRANKIRVALGGEPGMAYFIAPRPKGMWHRTYERQCKEIERNERQAERQFLSRYRDAFSQEELEMYFWDV